LDANEPKLFFERIEPVGENAEGEDSKSESVPSGSRPALPKALLAYFFKCEKNKKRFSKLDAGTRFENRISRF